MVIVPMGEVMRLLVALAGGKDGETFVLEDPMQVTNEQLSIGLFRPLLLTRRGNASY